jgi:thiamine biosynthesis lipoprotein
MSRRRPFVVAAAVIITASIFLSSCAKKESVRTDFVLGTVCTVNLFEKGTVSAQDEVFARLRELDAILSANRDDSNIAAINANAGIAPVAATEETLKVLREALVFAEKTGGLFDPTVGALVKAWNIGTDYAAVPTNEEIAKTRSLIGWTDVVIDDAAGTVFLKRKEMRLDLGAIAKGYAADECVRIIAKRGIDRAIIDLGGNIYAYGEKAKDTPWTIGIRDPENDSGESVLSLKVSDRSVVTSGVYERYFVENGRRYHHILDPRTGYPANNNLLSVTIVAKPSMLADALSTSVFLLGAEKGLELIEASENTEAIFIDLKGNVLLSSGLKGQVNIIDSHYTITTELSALP